MGISMENSKQSEINGFLNMLSGQNNNLKGLFIMVAERLGISYKNDCEKDSIVKIRHEGKWVPLGEGGFTWDSGIDYSEENWPDSYNDIDEALNKIHQPAAMWYHNPSMNLVIMDKSGEKIGIMSTALRHPMLGLHAANIKALVDGLCAKMTCN